MSSMEGFSPGSHSGELTPQAAAQEEPKRRGGGDKEHLIPWVLIPITGLTLSICPSSIHPFVSLYVCLPVRRVEVWLSVSIAHQVRLS